MCVCVCVCIKNICDFFFAPAKTSRAQTAAAVRARARARPPECHGPSDGGLATGASGGREKNAIRDGGGEDQQQ